MLGAGSRYLLTLPFSTLHFPSFFSTLGINLLGVIVLAYIGTRGQWSNPFLSLYKTEIVGGFLGSFTTFSTFIFDFSALIAFHSYVLAIGYLGITIGGSLLGSWVIARESSSSQSNVQIENLENNLGET